MVSLFCSCLCLVSLLGFDFVGGLVINLLLWVAVVFEFAFVLGFELAWG